MIAKIFFLAIFLVVGGRAFYLQVLQGDRLMRLGQRQHLKEWIVLPKRGAVFDRAGEPLALSMEAQSVYARPQRIQDADKSESKFGADSKNQFGGSKQKAHLGQAFCLDQAADFSPEAGKIQALKIEGIGMFYEPNRYYPQGQLAGQLIGFVGRDSEGLEGLELQVQ